MRNAGAEERGSGTGKQKKEADQEYQFSGSHTEGDFGPFPWDNPRVVPVRGKES